MVCISLAYCYEILKRDFCIFIIICSAQFYKALSIVWFSYCWKKSCGFVFMFPKFSFSRSWCLDSHELISTNITSGRLNGPKVHSSFSACPPWFHSSHHPLLLSREFLCNWCQPSQRWARDSGPANKVVPSFWSWLAHGWAHDPGPGGSILGFGWIIWRGELPVRWGCSTGGWKPGPNDPGSVCLNTGGLMVWSEFALQPCLPPGMWTKNTHFLCMAAWVTYGHFEVIEHGRDD